MSVLSLTLSTLEQTQQLGALLAGLAQPGDRLFLIGEIGAGKTTLARAIGATLQADPPLTSPTFVLMSEHHGTMPIWHGDAYRLPDGSDPLAHGLIDERQASGLTIMEWPNLLRWPTSDVSAAQITITLQPGVSEEQRIVQIAWDDAARLERLQKALRAAGLELHDA
ncbi:MAG: tRNA (adenosine(37)-N6)-threonylcarbamoyltransferase complex ATPase subunit type 1 TsaE [Chloroflexi bacterium]|nr:tRNA (adenosine(37)-N6)-threonylcarbamoyltransferase complex ATPase subunit type 1 TsaE [Chloroflexota bacterium]